MDLTGRIIFHVAQLGGISDLHREAMGAEADGGGED